MKNKFTSLIVAIILMFGSFISVWTSDTVTTVGAGNGDDTSIESFEDLATLLNFIKESEKDSLYSYGDGNVGYATLSNRKAIGDIINTAQNSKDTHESVTVHFSTSLSSSSSSSNPEHTGGLIESSNTLNRELTLYITPKGTFYASSGMTTSYKKSLVKDNPDKETRDYLKWDMLIFVNDVAEYVFINELICIDNGSSLQIKTENKGKWIKASHDTGFGIIDVDYENREVLGALGEMLDVLIKYDYISPGSDSVKINENDLIDLLEKEGEDSVDFDDKEIDFTVDISNPSNPWISSVSSVDSEKTEKILTGYDKSGYIPTPTYEYCTITNKSTVSQDITIKNIDNTVINFDTDNVSIEIEDDEDFEKLFIIEESDEDDE